MAPGGHGSNMGRSFRRRRSNSAHAPLWLTAALVAVPGCEKNEVPLGDFTQYADEDSQDEDETGDENSDAWPSEALEAWIPRFASLLCAQQMACGCTTDGKDDPETCQEEWEEHLWEITHIGDSGVVDDPTADHTLFYNEDCGEWVLETYEQHGCSAEMLAEPGWCGSCQLIYGTRERGQSCVPYLDHGKLMDACALGLQCVPDGMGEHTCQDWCGQALQLGEVCWDEARKEVGLCAEGYAYCDRWGTQQCTAYAPLGAGCEDRQCDPATSYCAGTIGSRVCSARVGLDQACTPGGACEDPLYCDPDTSVCVEPKGLGEPCESGQCAEEFLCMGVQGEQVCSSEYGGVCDFQAP